MYDKKITVLLGRLFAKILLIKSWSGDFLTGSFLIIYSISPGEVFLVENDMERDSYPIFAVVKH